MLYSIGNTTIDSDEYREKFKKGYCLPVMKEIIDLSGCSLKEVKDLIDKVIDEENIEIDPISKEFYSYAMAEWNGADGWE